MITGLAIGGYSFSNMFGNVLAGRWIDRIGPKKILVTGLALTGLVILLYTTVTTGEQLVGVRLIHGLTAGLLSPSAFTLASGLSSQGKQGKAMALSGAAVGIAAILGPAYSGIMGSKVGVEWVFLTVSGLMLLTALIAGLWLPNAKRKAANVSEPLATPATTSAAAVHVKEASQRSASLKEFLAIFNLKPVINAYIGSFALMFSLGIVAYMLPLKVEALGMNSATSGMLLSTFGIIAILMFTLPINKIYDTIESQKIMITGIFIVTASLLFLSLFTNPVLLYISMGIFGLGFALMFPSMNSIIITYVSEKNRGKAFGLFYALFSLGVVAGSFTVGALAASPAFGFMVGSAILLTLSIYVTLMYLKHAKHGDRSTVCG